MGKRQRAWIPTFDFKTKVQIRINCNVIFCYWLFDSSLWLCSNIWLIKCTCSAGKGDKMMNHSCMGGAPLFFIYVFFVHTREWVNYSTLGMLMSSLFHIPVIQTDLNVFFTNRTTPFICSSKLFKCCFSFYTIMCRCNTFGIKWWKSWKNFSLFFKYMCF